MHISKATNYIASNLLSTVPRKHRLISIYLPRYLSTSTTLLHHPCTYVYMSLHIQYSISSLLKEKEPIRFITIKPPAVKILRTLAGQDGFKTLIWIYQSEPQSSWSSWSSSLSIS